MVEESVVYARIERMSHPTHALFHHTSDLLDRERKNSAKISPLEGVADVMFKRGTGFSLSPRAMLVKILLTTLDQGTVRDHGQVVGLWSSLPQFKIMFAAVNNFMFSVRRF